MDQITEKILNAMNETFEIDNANESTSQENCENWDSMNHLNFVMALEDTFEVSFEPEEIGTMKDFISVKTLVEKKITNN